jgi:hemolysin activation/secretion protein
MINKNKKRARRCARAAVTGLAAAAIVSGAVGPAAAQAVRPGLERRTTPSDQPELPEPRFLPPDEPRFELPPLPPAPPDRLGAAPLVLVRDVVFTGNTVVPTEELEAIARPYEGREVTLEELFRLRDELTLAYVNRGYVNSGAALLDQDVTAGTVRFEIVEGALGAIDISGTRALDPAFLERRVRLGAGPPLNVNDLQDRLQLLLLDPTIERLDARLLPGARPGLARLELQVEELPRSFAIDLSAANDESPSIGGTRGALTFTWRNLFGRSDPLALTVDATQGLREASFAYSVPLTARDLRFHVDGEVSDAEVIDDDVEELDIESGSRRLTVGLGLPIVDTVANRVGLDVSLSRERTRTYLLDEPFSFSPGTDRGRADLTLLRFTQGWQNRGRRRAVSVASTFTWGLDALGATDNEDDPDGQFFAWLGQGEVAHRVFGDRDQLVLRGTLQLTADPLLASEQFTLGGLGSVRGYRVNEVVRDMGWTTSLEYRLPISDLFAAEDRVPDPTDSTLELVPFVDAGYAFDHRGNPEELDSETLASVGLGLRWTLPPRLSAEVYWGYPLLDRVPSSDDPLQDAGIGFRVNFNVY